MQRLKDKIKEEGKYLGKGILKVDSFMNHQIDPLLMKEIGLEFAARFKNIQATKILTAEASGIAPSLALAIALELPVVFARKNKPVTMAQKAYTQRAESHTQGKVVDLSVSSEYLGPEDRIIIIDDFLASARTIKALIKLVEESGATLVAIGAVIEKDFEGGRQVLGDIGVPVESLARIKGFDDDFVHFFE
jgi:xanthine phosphoribosyltransferase